MSTRLIARHLAKNYGKKQVVSDVSLAVGPGEIVGLLGPNGAGKTTCFYMIVGLVPATAGQVTLGAQDLTHLPMHRRARLGVGYLPQEASVFRKLTVAQNLMAVLELRPDLKRAQRRAKMETLLEEFRIGHIRDTQGIALSGGERRRVEIARALASEPAIVLLDEPFAGVDPISVTDIKDIVYQLRDRGIGVLITDHNVRETLDICDRAYIVGTGTIIAEGQAEAILSNQKVRDVYLGENFRL